MSWTVTTNEDHDAEMTKGITDILNQVVDDDFDSPSKAPSDRNGNHSELFGNGKHGSSFMSQGPPRALNPSELQHTPVKDGGMEGFSSWVRQQQGTPNSNRTSPTPTGAYLPQSQASPPSATRTAGSGGNSPMKYTTGENSPTVPNSQIEALQEERRRLMLQMEELQLQEAELRRSGAPYDPYGLMSPNIQQPQFQGLQSPQQQLTVDNVRGRIYETAKDQHGCRFLQRLLDQAPNESIEAAQLILSEILQNIPELMTDQYANFLVQKLFDMMPHDVRYTVAQVAAPHLCQISLTPHGTFSVQKLIETIATREEMEVVQSALKVEVVQLVKDVHGNHVIQKVLQRFEHQDTQFIYDALTADCVAIATNKQGCCVLQRCLEYASDAQRQQMVKSIVGSALTLVQDPFGNYVVQYVLDGKDVHINDAIADLFLPHLVMLSTNKFSSNVVEKVIKGSSVALKEKYVMLLFDQNILMRLLRDDYGNYVVQTALTEAPYNHAEQLVMCIRPVLHHIRNAPYAKKLEAKMDLCLKKKSGNFGHSPHGHRHRHHDHPHQHHHHQHGNPHHHHMHSPTHHMPPHAMHHHNQHDYDMPSPQHHRPFRATAAPWSPQLSMDH